MPITPTYPGVYIEEIPSGVRTITGVATSITAFVGRALRGPTSQPVTINSFSDFERIFGGLWVWSSMGFAIRDFYANGGSQAVVIRIYRPKAAGGTDRSKFAIGDLKFVAASQGKWGANVRGWVDYDVSQSVADQFGVTKDQLFNLTLVDSGHGGITEQFRNVTLVNSPQRVDTVLEQQSSLAQWDGTLDPAHPPALPKPDAGQTTKGDPIADAMKAMAAAQLVIPPVQADIDKAKTALDKAIKDRADAVDDGDLLKIDDFFPANGARDKKGLFALENTDLFNLLCIPPYTSSSDVDVPLVSAAAAYCEQRRAMLLMDPPSTWKDKSTAKDKFSDANTDNVGTRSRNAALFFPRLRQPNQLKNNVIEDFAPCGAVAGILARTDTQRGVWKAPAGLDASLVGVPQLSVPLTDAENGELNPLGINCLRSFPIIGRVVWGARTLRGADQLADEYKYIPVRRLALFLEESLYRGTKWVVFEPNDEPLWAQIRLNIGAFMHNLFRQGAFQGRTPREAYFVKCDNESTTQNDINLGIVNIIVGFAPLKPAEFVIIKIQQMAGQIEV